MQGTCAFCTQILLEHLFLLKKKKMNCLILISLLKTAKDFLGVLWVKRGTLERTQICIIEIIQAHLFFFFIHFLEIFLKPLHEILSTYQGKPVGLIWLFGFCSVQHGWNGCVHVGCKNDDWNIKHRNESGAECEAPSQPRAQCEVKHLHLSYFRHTSPFIVVSSNVNMVCPEALRQWDQTETSFFPPLELIPGTV